MHSCYRLACIKPRLFAGLFSRAHYGTLTGLSLAASTVGEAAAGAWLFLLRNSMFEHSFRQPQAPISGKRDSKARIIVLNDLPASIVHLQRQHARRISCELVAARAHSGTLVSRRARRGLTRTSNYVPGMQFGRNPSLNADCAEKSVPEPSRHLNIAASTAG